MALVVQTNMGAVTALKYLNWNTLQMNKAMERLSSGFRVNSAADDASGYAIASKLAAQAEGLKAASLNVSQAIAMVKMADAGVNEIQNMLVRIKALATQAASANNAGELAKLEAERVKLETAIDKIANSTRYNGIALLNGNPNGVATPSTATAKLVFQVGADNNTNNQITINLANKYTATGLGLNGAGVAALTTQTKAQNYITTVDTALNKLINQRADLGATINQLSYVQANLATSIEQVTASVSTIKDADMAAEMANFTKSRILVQAGTAMLAQANQTAQNVLALFR